MIDEAGFEAPEIFGIVARELLDRVPVTSRDRVLDLACGSGMAGAEAARRGAGRVASIDVDRRRLRAGSAAAACQARAESLPVRDGAASLVLCQHGLMFFDDRHAALAEARRVLSPAGRFAATCWGALSENPGFAALHGAIEAHLGVEAGAMAARPFSLPDPDALAGELEAAGLDDPRVLAFAVSVRVASIRDFARWYLFGTSLAALARERRVEAARVQTRVEEELGERAGTGEVVLPCSAYCVVGSRG